MFLWTWLRRASHPVNGQNRKEAARLWGVAPFRMCAFPSGKGWYHGMEPRYLLMLKTLCYDCVNWLRALGEKVPKDRGMAYSVSCYSVRGNPALCWQRSGLVLGTSFQRRFHVAMGSSLAWPFVGNPKKQYETCTVLVVEPAMECGGNLLLNIVSYSRHSSKCLCWLRFIFYFRNEFFSTLCTSNNIKCSFKCVSSIFDYHKEKSPPILRLHCVCVRQALW